MTLEELRDQVRTMKVDAAERVRRYGRLLNSDPAFVDALIAALGTISVDEALDALERED